MKLRLHLVSNPQLGTSNSTGLNKYSSLVLHVIAPSLSDELRVDIEGAKYNILIDESTDASTQKCFLFFDQSRQNVATAMAGLMPVVHVTGGAVP